MFGNAWLTLRQIREALRTGRLEEAQRLLASPSARGHKDFFDMQKQLVHRFIERGQRHLRADQAEQAWSDLIRAEAVAPNDPLAAGLRQSLGRLGVAEARGAMEAGRPDHAAQTIARLKDRGVHSPELAAIGDAARDWNRSLEQADQGEFVPAINTLDKLRMRLPQPTSGLDRARTELAKRHESFARLIVDLHASADARHWRQVVQLADQVLAVAPQHPQARRVRTDAWRAIEPETLPISAPARPDSTPAEPAEPAGPPRRLLLWIDGVGGYLVCLGQRVTLGQASGEGPVDIPLLADVSRMHATLSRDAEGYLIEAARPVQVNGTPTTRALLQPGDRLTLGSSCQFVFRVPVPVSTSARLEIVSGHRLSYGVDAILLMSDTLVLGRGDQAHVTMAETKENLVLYKQRDGLALRYPGPFSVDGRPCRDRGPIGLEGAVRGPDFAFAVEPALRA